MVLTKCSHLLRKVTTPFLFESQRMSPVSKPASDASEASWSTCPWRKHQYVGGCAPKTCTICMRSIRSRGGIVTTSASEGSAMDSLARESYYPQFPKTCDAAEATPSNVPAPDIVRGLNIIAARIIMKILYGARVAQQDLLRPVCVLARMLTKWDGQCGKRLMRTVTYINSTLGYRLRGWIGDKGKFLEHLSSSDADFAGCVDTQRSTTGSFHMIHGPIFAVSDCDGKQATVLRSSLYSRAGDCCYAHCPTDCHHSHDGALEAPSPGNEIHCVW